MMLTKIFSRKMLVCFLMGYGSGLPLLLTMSTLQAWLKDEQVSLVNIGLITLIGMPYSWKFIWAPIFDRFSLPMLGRRRGWLLASQLLLTASIFSMGLFNPNDHLVPLIIVAILVAFFSASQDIVIDAFRREYLHDEELGLGSSMYVYGYRIAMILSSSGALILADQINWGRVYFVMSLAMLPAMLTTFWAKEPEVTEKSPTNFKEAVIDPFSEFFSRHGSILILLFILLYKLGDTMASAMTMPFYLEIGFSKTEIGVVAKGTGLAANLIGMAIGGAMTLRWGIGKCLYIFGVLQALSTAFFSLLVNTGPDLGWLSFVIGFENFSGGTGTAAFIAYMATQTNKKFTATQYALLTSLIGIPRTILSAPTGYLAETWGWSFFFIFCALIAIPGMILLFKLVPWGSSMDSNSKKY
jgi:PAT family beta-lactamase induction signal transducer AmpG